MNVPDAIVVKGVLYVAGRCFCHLLDVLWAELCSILFTEEMTFELVDS